MEEIQRTRIQCASKDSSLYPARLQELSGMPKQLYYIGRFPDDDKPTAAIVGARLCSPYGRIQAFNYGKVQKSDSLNNGKVSKSAFQNYGKVYPNAKQARNKGCAHATEKSESTV